MRVGHRMPFGAEYDGGGARFSLWAPASERVILELDGYEPVAMSAQDDGFHVAHVDGIAPGVRYRYAIDDSPLRVPDPASRFNPEQAEGASELIDPRAFEWRHDGWSGLAWRDAVFYELHVGTFTPEGTFAAAIDKLDHLKALGITAIELMPLADGPGARNWGYDGVLPFAIRPAYGRPEDLKRFIEAAHGAGLAVFLDVVYNHFGPQGNYLHHYAPQFFTSRHRTPWGDAINFDGEHSRVVRSFFIHNALYWLEEYRFDGLRLDAVHAIIDDSTPDVLIELADAVRDRCPHAHLVLENGDNEAHYLDRGHGKSRSRAYTAQWNDDFHHVMHVLLTGERAGYYADYDRPGERLLRCLVEGFAYQGEPSAHWGGRPRGEPSAHLPPEVFVNFLQNHDQIGNRAFGERLHTLTGSDPLRAAETLLLLLPTPILIFMGDEFEAPNPFPFFCDFEGDLAEAIRRGRREEFSHFFENVAELDGLPDPLDPRTFELARLDWRAAQKPKGADTLARYRKALALRREVLAPRLPAAARPSGRLLAERAVRVDWTLADGSVLTLIANLSDSPLDQLAPAWPGRAPLLSSKPLPVAATQFPPWCAAWWHGMPRA